MKNRALFSISISLSLFFFISCDTGDGDVTVNYPDSNCETKTWYEDADGDGKGNPAISITACEQPEGYVLDNTDEDDSEGEGNSNSIYMDLDTYTHINRSTKGEEYERWIYYFENGKIVKKETYITTNFSRSSNYQYDQNYLIDYIDDTYYDQDYLFENNILKECKYYSDITYTQSIYSNISSNNFTHKLYNGFDNSLSLEEEITLDTNSRVTKIIRNSYNPINRSYTGTFKYNNSLLESIQYLNEDESIDIQTFENLELNSDNFYNFYNKSLYGNNIMINEYTDDIFPFLKNFSLDYKSGTCYLNGEPVFEIQTEFDSKGRIVKRTYYSIDRKNSEDIIEEFTYKN